MTGLMWSADAPGEAISITLANGLARFRERFGCLPDTVYLNERQFDLAGEVAGLRLRPAKNVLKNTVFLTREEA